MNSRLRLSFILALSVLVAVLFLGAGPVAVEAQVLVGDPFIDSYNNWVDTFTGTPQVGQLPDWRLNILNETMMESSDGRAGDGATNAGDYTPYVLIQDDFTSPDVYNLSARMYTSDDDLFGVVFGWQDINNYFRVGMREQSSGSLGGTVGLSVQKVVGGVVTQINPMGTGPGNTAVPTQAMIDNREPINLLVAVDGQDYSISVDGVNGGMPLASGSDADLRPGKIGIQSWAQRNDTGAAPTWGVEVDHVSVNHPILGVNFFHDDFDNFSPLQWRQLVMTNSAGVTLPVQGDDNGNFGLDFRNDTIHDNSNGFEWATAATQNIDFIGPAIVVDEPGSESFTDYEMRVRMQNNDNDGIGVLVRVQDDSNFYRVNFSREGMGTVGERAPSGLSVQKVRDAAWTELFRDDQNNPLFVYEENTPFDVSVRAIGDQLFVEVIEDPDGAANIITYPVITDGTNPLLSGTVGLANWGSGLGDGGAMWSAFGGVEGPLLTVIPEPATVALAAIACLGVAGLLRRRRT